LRQQHFEAGHILLYSGRPDFLPSQDLAAEEINKGQPNEKSKGYLSELVIARVSATMTCVFLRDSKTGKGVGKF
jgi:hypothetical protein